MDESLGGDRGMVWSRQSPVYKLESRVICEN